jgi:hypothetical protein
MCTLYSITTNQAAIIALFRVINRYASDCYRISGVIVRDCDSDQSVA